MTTDPNAPVEQLPIPPVADGNEPDPSKDKVAYETYKKVVAEKKRFQERAEQLEAQNSERERKDLEAKGEYQKLLELERAKSSAAESKLTQIESERQTAKKAAALLKALEHGIPEKFYGFLPMDEVVVDPDTGEVNQLSVAKAAEEFRKNYPELLIKPNGPRLPTEAPRGNGAGMITVEDYAKLPLDEMKKWKPHQLIYK